MPYLHRDEHLGDALELEPHAVILGRPLCELRLVLIHGAAVGAALVAVLELPQPGPYTKRCPLAQIPQLESPLEGDSLSGRTVLHN